MKIRRITAIVLCLLLLTCVLGGCSANGSVSGDVAYDNYNGAENILSGSASSGSVESDVAANRKLIRRISMEAETEDMDALLVDVNDRIAELGGYIESRNIQNGSAYSDSRSRYAKLVIRLPAESLDKFLQQVSESSNVVSTQEDSDDVTLEYVATESRLSVLRTEEERLLQFLSEAESISEMLDIEKRLTDVQSEIEAITTQLNTYDNLVDYGTVTLSVREVEVYTVIEEEEPTMWEEITVGFRESVDSLLQIGKALVVFVLANSPYLVLIGIVVAVVLLCSRAAHRRTRRRHTPTPPPAQSE